MKTTIDIVLVLDGFETLDDFNHHLEVDGRFEGEGFLQFPYHGSKTQVMVLRKPSKTENRDE